MIKGSRPESALFSSAILDFVEKRLHKILRRAVQGLAQVANWVKLKFVAMNLKKFAKWKWKESYNLLHFLLAYFLDARNPVYRSTVGRVSRQTEGPALGTL